MRRECRRGDVGLPRRKCGVVGGGAGEWGGADDMGIGGQTSAGCVGVGGEWCGGLVGGSGRGMGGRGMGRIGRWGLGVGAGGRGALWVRTEITNFTKWGDDWSGLLGGALGERRRSGEGWAWTIRQTSSRGAPWTIRQTSLRGGTAAGWRWKGIVGHTSG